MARLAVVGAFFAGAFLVAACVVAYGPAASAPGLSLAQKKAMLKNIAAAQTSVLATVTFGANDISDTASAEGNNGATWNYGANFGGANAKAVARGWTSGADTVHAGGVGMFGAWGTDEVKPKFAKAERGSNTCPKGYSSITSVVVCAEAMNALLPPGNYALRVEAEPTACEGNIGGCGVNSCGPFFADKVGADEDGSGKFCVK